jgi:glycosyltransferase involved in cell wall biosynthesis
MIISPRLIGTSSSSLHMELDVRDGLPGIETIDDVLFLPPRPAAPGRRPDINGQGGMFDRHGAYVQAAATLRRGGRHALEPLRYGEAQADVDEEVLYLGFLMPQYGHALLEGTARLWAIEHLGWRGRLLVHAENPNILSSPEGRFIAGLLEVFGICSSRILVPTVPTRFRRVHVAWPTVSFCGYIYRSVPSAFERAAQRWANDVVPSDVPLYLSKVRSPSSRPNGEARLVHALEQQGVAIAHPQNLSIKQQIRLINGHRTLIGPIGSALHNHMFSLSPMGVIALWAGQPYWDVLAITTAAKKNPLSLLDSAYCPAPGNDWDMDVEAILAHLKSENLLRASAVAAPLTSRPDWREPPEIELKDHPNPLPAKPSRKARITQLPGLRLIAGYARLRHYFDAETYWRQWPDRPAARLLASLHYLLIGRHHGATPTPLFDPVFYGASNPDVAAAGGDLFLHYIRHGWREGRKPSLLFDPHDYLEQNSDVRRQQIEPLRHYLNHGAREGRMPAHHPADTVAAEPLGGVVPLVLAEPAERVVLQVLHGQGGGVEEHCRDLDALLTQDGIEAWMLQSLSPDIFRLCCPIRGIERHYHLSRPPDEEALLADMQTVSPDHVHLHHVIGFGRRLWDWIVSLGVPYDVTIHDYAFICPRVTLLDGRHRYCGEDALVATCDHCIDHFGAYPHLQADYDELGGTAPWRAHWYDVLRKARRVFVPDEDVAERFARYFNLPNLRIKPHPEPISRIPSLEIHPAHQIKVAIIGSIGPHKGFDILRACAELAAREKQPLHFVVFGNVAAPEELEHLETVTLTGRYRRSELSASLAQAGCAVAAFLSIWPETFTYALSEGLRAGLYPITFDLGAPARRLRRLGWGSVLPIGSSPRAINAELMARGLSRPLAPAGAVLGAAYPSLWTDYYERENG